VNLPPPFQPLPDDPLPDDPLPNAPTTPAHAAAQGTATTDPPAASEPSPHPEVEIASGRLGLLGPTASGKTTFLAALAIAAEQYRPGWMLYGDNDAAQDFLKANIHLLRRRRTFPSATMNLQPEMRFVLQGPRLAKRRGSLLTRRRKVKAAVFLDILDAPGGFYAWPDPDAAPDKGSDLDSGAAPADGGGDSDRTKLALHLGESAGLILLVDPVLADSPEYDAYDYFKNVVLDIARQSAMRSPDEFLPQYLAVCLTKCDHPNVYRKARDSGLVIDGADEHGFPHVSERMAREFFDEFCEGPRPGRSTGRASELRDAIQHSFSPHRTRFFMTSAVGFRQDPMTGVFEQADPMNVGYETGLDDGEQPWIAGPVRPVNVLEPVLWLAGTQVRNHS
jgi:energy-coupling factor transporter ATP-binding protein EcfA2